MPFYLRISNMGKRWLSEHKQDAYYKKAKKDGYRSRAAFKLQQLNDRFKLIKSGDAVIELGAAPGGWSQVIMEMVGNKGFLIGVDLQGIKPIDGMNFIKGDFTEEETRASMDRIMKKHGREKVDAVVSDMSPNISGHYSMDQARSIWLAGLALDSAKQHLKPGGNFLVKVFEGEDFKPFLDKVKEAFRDVKVHSPSASRKSSSEVYVAALGFKG